MEMPSFYTETSAQRPADHRDAITIQRPAHRDLQTIEMPSFYTETSAQRLADHRDAIILYRDKRTETCKDAITLYRDQRTETCRPYRWHHSTDNKAHRIRHSTLKPPDSNHRGGIILQRDKRTETDHRDAITLYRDRRTETTEMPSCTETSAHTCRL